jgi:hypothetical protein
MLRRFKRDVVLCDLDGTICFTDQRWALSPTVDPNSSWSVYAKACSEDEPIWGVIQIVHRLYKHNLVHFISGRDGSSFKETEAWLRKYGIKYDRLTLRPEDNEDSNADIKVSYIHKIRTEGLNPILLLDDWRDTCLAAESVGVPAIQVANMEYRDIDAGKTFSGNIVAR